jgi:hypothetical protein
MHAVSLAERSCNNKAKSKPAVFAVEAPQPCIDCMLNAACCRR